MPIGSVDEERARLTIVMGLHDKFIENLAGFYYFVRFNWHSGFFSLGDGAAELFVFRSMDIREAQFPISISLNSLHESIGDRQRNIKVGDGVFVGLTLDKIFHVGVVNAQNPPHVGSTAGTALGDLTERVVINLKETNRSGRLTGRSFDNFPSRAQAREVETITATGLLDQGGIA